MEITDIKEYIINPLTKRKIMIYGSLYNKLVKSGDIKDIVLEAYRERMKLIHETFYLDDMIKELEDDDI